MIILVDMDGVIADFEKGVLTKWRELYGDEPLIDLGTRKSFYIGSGESPEKTQRVNHIIHTQGFFQDLEPIAGGLEAIQEMTNLGHKVFILTSPGVSYPNAASEKYRWVEKHMGRHMLEYLVITPAKAIVRGDILIDDRPEVHFENKATWEHVLFDASYNRDVTDKKRVTWGNWKEVLSELL